MFSLRNRKNVSKITPVLGAMNIFQYVTLGTRNSNGYIIPDRRDYQDNIFLIFL